MLKEHALALLGWLNIVAHNCMAAADSAVVLFELDVQWDLTRTH